MAIQVVPAIPASQIVNVVPSVLAAGGDALDLIGMILTTNTRPPIGQVLKFVDAVDVASFFGSGTQEEALSIIYFNGPRNATATPGALLVTQYPLTEVNAYLRGGAVSGLSLAQLQAIGSGTITVTIDGTPVTSTTINLSGATSLSSAAALIWEGLDVDGPTQASFTGSIAGTVLTVSAMTSGTLGLGDRVTGTGVTDDTTIISFGTATGSVGTYNVGTSQTAISATMGANAPGCYYDSVSGAFVVQSGTTGAASTIAFASGTDAFTAALKLTSVTGATLSQGADAAVPGTFMDTITTFTQDWASFMTSWEPVDADKEAFATWTNGKNNRYVYEMWDTDVTNTQVGLGSAAVQFINSGQLSGVVMIHEDPDIDTVGGELAAFGMGWTASLDFTRLNGRQTQKFKGQPGLAPQIFSGTVANNLVAKGMNFFGDYTTANESFLWYSPGLVSGEFVWKDSYVNQIWLNAQLQLAIMVGLDNTPSIPYNSAGYALIESFCMDPINQGVNFGAIVAGVDLSEAQKTEVNRASGLTIDPILFQRGWYLQVRPAIAQVRRARTSPPCTLWYCDGGSIQSINLASIEIQ